MTFILKTLYLKYPKEGIGIGIGIGMSVAQPKNLGWRQRSGSQITTATRKRMTCRVQRLGPKRSVCFLLAEK